MDNNGVIGFLKQANDLIHQAVAALNGPEEPSSDEPLWLQLIRQTVLTGVIPHELKPAFIAQAIQETGRGKSKLFVEHHNPAGMKWREELEEFARPVEVEVTSEPTGRAIFCHFDSVIGGIMGYMKFVKRSVYDGWHEYTRDPAGYLRHLAAKGWATDPDYLRACLSHLPEARSLLERYGWKTEVMGGRLDGKSFLIDAGHSRGAQGASSRDKRVTEYSMTSMMAGIVAERLREHGATVDLYDPNPDNLRALGQRAKGKTAACYIHLNAANADGNDEGTEVFVHRNASTACRNFASAMCRNICEALGTKNRGVKTAGYTVLVEAHAVGQEFAVLPESFFLDDWTDVAKITERCVKSAHAIADTIIETFGRPA